MSTQVPLDELLASLSTSNDIAVRTEGLPPACYTDEAFHEFELDRIFRAEWTCVGRVEMLPETGDYLAITVLGEPLVLVRGADDEIRAMSAVCQHKGMVITDDADVAPEKWLDDPLPRTGHCNRVMRCPYHWWTYDLTGNLVGSPQMNRTEGFDPTEHGLPSVRAEVWNGFVFVTLDERAPALAPRLGKIDAALAPYDFGSLLTTPQTHHKHLPFNWKVMVENFLDGYHPDYLHRRLHDFAPNDNLEAFPFEPGDPGVIARVHTTVTDGGFNATFRALYPVMPGLGDLERNSSLFFWLAPTLLVGVNPDHAFWFVIAPDGPDHLDISIAYLFPKETMEMDRFPELLVMSDFGVQSIVNQDVPVNISVQRGRHSQFAPRGRASWQEESVASIHQWIVGQLTAGVQVAP